MLSENQIKVIAHFTGVISTGEFENERPLFGLEQIIHYVDDDVTAARQKELYGMCRKVFKEAQRDSLIARIRKQREDIRFYEKDGMQYPSVTSIIGWDDDYHISPEELAQHAARGTIIHKQIAHYIKEGQWIDPLDLSICYPEIVILKRGNLKLSYDDVNFLGFLEKHPIEFISSEVAVYNDDLKYAGTYDFKGRLDKKITLFDVKCGASLDRLKAFKQLTAYAHCPQNQDVEQLCIVHLNNKVQQGFSKPIICTDVNKYWELFKADRVNFKKRFLV